jgi:serine protease Do
MTSGVPALAAWQPTLVFDLNGNLIGARWDHFWGESAVYAEAKLLRALWDDLIAGKNRDEARLGRLDLGKAGKESDEQSAIQPPALEKAAQATVRIRRKPADRGLSGVVVTADGLVATCAHHFVMPGNRVIICFPDGRDATGRVVGINLLCDIGLVQITDAGPWPHVEMGNSLRLRPGDPCLSIGYGPVQSRERQPSVRKSKVVAPGTGRWEYRLSTDPSTPFIGGDSGGGIFDAEGRLVAIHQQLGRVDPNGVSMPHKHPRVELFRVHGDGLRAAFEQSAASPLTAAQADLSQAAAAGQRSIAEVLDGKNTVALGTIISRDGRLLTKASVLPKSPSCRLFDGRVVLAKTVKISREHDLAVLKIQASDLPLAEWSSVDDPRIGTLVAIAGAGSSLSPAFVSHTTITIPPERGVIWTGLRNTAKGLEVVEVWKQLNPPVLRKGDIILSIDGQATPNSKAYLNLIHPKDGKPLAIAGDQLRLLVQRDGKEVEVLLPLGPPTLPRPEGQSPRYSGFARAFGVLVDTKFPLGGPVLDPNGHISGIAIAWQARGCLLVLPATTARTVISDESAN